MVLNPKTQLDKARDAQRKSDLKQIQNALEVYYNDYGKYPAGNSGNNYEIDGIVWGTSWTPYMDTFPKDPASAKNYMYASDEQAYYIYASLDRSDDAQICENLRDGDSANDNGGQCENVPAVDLCGAGENCNYGVSSPNVSP